MSLSDLVAKDNLKWINYPNGIPAYLHDEHRYCLVMAHYHQLSGELPKPANLILFDQHHDLAHLAEEAVNEIKNMRERDFSSNDLLALCDKLLRKDDSDWIYAGIELGIIGNLVSFEVKCGFWLGS